MKWDLDSCADPDTRNVRRDISGSGGKSDERVECMSEGQGQQCLR